MSTVSECYATMTNPFGALGPFYDALGHRGADYRRYARQTVVAYEDMTVELVGVSGGLGRVLAGRLKGGGWAGWAHLYDIRAVYGQVIRAGETFALVAGAGDSPGELWDGSHIHTTRSDVSAYNAAFGVRPLLDPVPRINLGIAKSLTSGTAGTGDTTPVLPAEQEEDDNMARNSGFVYTRKSDGAIVYLIANTESGFASEYTDSRRGVAMPSVYNNAVAVAFDTRTFAPITEGHATSIKRSLTIVDDDPVVIDINDADIKALIEAQLVTE